MTDLENFDDDQELLEWRVKNFGPLPADPAARLRELCKPIGRSTPPAPSTPSAPAPAAPASLALADADSGALPSRKQMKKKKMKKKKSAAPSTKSTSMWKHGTIVCGLLLAFVVAVPAAGRAAAASGLENDGGPPAP